MYRRGDVGAVARAFRILNALRGFKQGRTLAELAAAVGVSERTVRRDLADLTDADIDIELTRVDGRAAAVLVEASYSMVPITRRERYTLLAVTSVFDVLRGTPLHDDVTSVLAKLEQRMNTAERKEHASMRGLFAYVPDGGTKAYDGKEDIIDALQTGILSRKVVRYAYKDSRGRAKRGHLAPFALLLYRHGLYAVGCHSPDARVDTSGWRRTRGVFAVERFSEAEHVRESAFDIPADFKVDEVLHGAFGIHVGDPANAQRVVIEFTREKAALVEARLWHPTQNIERLEGGAIRLSFTCTNLTPVVSWVHEWGPHALVVEPTALVDAVFRELGQTRDAYRSRGVEPG
jgi:predicted DNA-binding transcriptional regulator YafY